MSPGLSMGIDGNTARGAHRGCTETPSKGSARVGRNCALAGKWDRAPHWEHCARGGDQEGHQERAQAGDAQVVSAIRRSTKCARGREGG